MSDPVISVGSVWRENDPRFERHIRVATAPSGGTDSRVGIQTVNEDGELVTKRMTFAAATAFGRRYRFVRP